MNDVIIVGAGPVGLWTALMLGQRGLKVLLCERWAEFYPLPRACGIDHEVMRMLQVAGLADSFKELLDPMLGEDKSYEFVNAQGERLLEVQWNQPGMSGWAQMNLFYQPDLERRMDAFLRDLPNVRVLRGHTASLLRQDAEGVELTLADESGVSRTEQASYLIGADGANSFVRCALGIEQTDLGFQYDWLVVDIQSKVQRKWHPYVAQHCDIRRPATSVGSGPGRRRWEFMRLPGESIEQLSSEETAWRLIEPWGVGPDNASLERHAVYTFRGRWANEWQRGRIFLMGDAAHLMPPFLAQGLCSGMRDAMALAWRLAMVLQDDACPSILDSYTSERSVHVQEIIGQAVELGRLICVLDPEEARIRDDAMLAALKDPSLARKAPPEPRLGECGLLYPGNSHGGFLSVQGPVSFGQKFGLFDDVIGGGWTLLSRHADPRQSLNLASRALAARLGLTIAHIGDIDSDAPVKDLNGVYADWFARLGNEAVLVRPDFYVYGASSLVEMDGMLAHLGEQLGWRVEIPALETGSNAGA